MEKGEKMRWIEDSFFPSFLSSVPSYRNVDMNMGIVDIVMVVNMESRVHIHVVERSGNQDSRLSKLSRERQALSSQDSRFTCNWETSTDSDNHTYHRRILSTLKYGPE